MASLNKGLFPWQPGQVLGGGGGRPKVGGCGEQQAGDSAPVPGPVGEVQGTWDGGKLAIQPPTPGTLINVAFEAQGQ